MYCILGEVSLPTLGQNSSVSSVLGLLSCVIQHRGFDPPLRRIFLVHGIFPTELTYVLTLLDESILLLLPRSI